MFVERAAFGSHQLVARIHDNMRTAFARRPLPIHLTRELITQRLDGE